jgi:hypothetical protein
MKQRFLSIIIGSAALALVSVASAQTNDARFSEVPASTNDLSSLLRFVETNQPASTAPTNTMPAAVPLALAPAPFLNRFGVSYHLGLNVSVDFKHLGGYTPQSPFLTPDGLPYNYDTGYVYPDNYPNQHPGLTWNYGYVAGVPTGNPSFSLYRSSSTSDAQSLDNYGDPQHGFELTYNRQLGKWHRAFYGLETGFSFTDFTVNDSRSYQGTVVHTTNTFAAGGSLIPAPFQGNAAGPPPGDIQGWPLVGLTPVGSATTGTFVGAASITGSRSIDARIFSFRLGPYLDYPLGEKWTASLSAGLSLVYINSQFKFNETVSIDPNISLINLPPESSSSSGTSDDFLVGGYVGGTIAYSLTDRWRLFTGAEWQGTGNLARYQGTKEAVFNLGASVFVNFGVSYSF